MKASSGGRLTASGRVLSLESSLVSAESNARFISRSELQLRDSFVAVSGERTRVQIDSLRTGEAGKSGLDVYGGADVELWDRVYLAGAKLEAVSSKLYGKAPFELALSGPDTSARFVDDSQLLLFPYTRLELKSRASIRLRRSWLQLRRHSVLELQSGLSNQRRGAAEPTRLTLHRSGIHLLNFAQMVVGSGVDLRLDGANLTVGYRAELRIRGAWEAVAGSEEIPLCLLGYETPPSIGCNLEIREGQRVYWHVPLQSGRASSRRQALPDVFSPSPR